MKKILLNLLLVIFFIVPSFGQDVFINEIKYQAPSGEEFIEVSGPTGDTITGWEIILYDEIPLPYDTISLEGVLPYTEGCNGIVDVDVAVLFTIPGSGMALVDAQGQLIQYLTYGDTTTGTINSGIIEGVTSENIGTQLNSFGSLQLTGVGETYEDFTWNLLDAATPGEVNTNQVFNGVGCILPLLVLPVELVEFKGEAQGENIVLSWLTLSETNHSHFEILHSTTGIGMQEVGRVYEAINESGETKKYEFIFPNITHANNYFQLRQVDVDGESEWSDIVSVSTRADVPVKISPNPATNFIDIEIQFSSVRTDEANIIIIDSQGKNVFTKQTALSELDSISIESLASGLYILIVQSGTISKQVKFIKR